MTWNYKNIVTNKPEEGRRSATVIRFKTASFDTIRLKVCPVPSGRWKKVEPEIWLGGLIAHADSEGFRLLMTSDAANRLSEGPQAKGEAVAERPARDTW